MTTESNDNDPRVSSSYRSLATETTPQELDHKILSLAAGGARSRYGLVRAWIRPAAWAATIGLSLAFVLEISQFRDASAPPPDAEGVEILDEALIRDKAPARAKTGGVEKPSDAPVRAQQVNSPAAEASPAPQAEVGLATGGRATVTADFEADQMTLIQEAEEQVRSRGESERAPASAMEARSLDAATPLEKKEQAEQCDQDARSSAATWYACIEELRYKGLADAAKRELESLQLEFPDFEVSEQSR
jgi:hypothetical protein